MHEAKTRLSIKGSNVSATVEFSIWCGVQTISCRNLSPVSEEKAVTTEGPAHIAELLEKLDIVKVARNLVRGLVEVESLATVLAHVHGVGTTHAPNLIGISVRYIRYAVSAGLDTGFLEIKGVLGKIGLLGANEYLATVQSHPKALVNVTLNKTHILNTTRSATVVRDPKVLSRFPGEEEVTTGRNSEVGAIVVTNLVDDGTGEVRSSANSTATDTVKGGINGLLHLRLPVPSSILGDVDGTRRGGHLRLRRAKGINRRGLAGELGREGNALPRLASILGVEEQRRLTKDPALTILEGGDLETVRHLLIGVKIRERASLPRLTTIVGLSKGTTGTDEITVVGTTKED